jgi:hypothetical protein
MVVDDFDMRRSSLIPDETNSPLIVDPDRVLPLPVGFQRFKPIARWNTKVREHPGLIQKTKLPQHNVLNVRRQFPAPPAGPDQLCFGSAKFWIMGHYNVVRYSSQLLVFG